MRRGWLCFVFWLALAAAFPTAAAADTVGAFEVTGGTLNKDYSYAGGVLTVHDGANITISMAAGAPTPTTDRIVIAADADTTVTLSGVQIDAGGGAPALFVEDGSGSVTVVLADGTDNSLRGRAGLGKNVSAGSLRIACLSAYDSGTGHECTDACGSLTARGTGYGAGIGAAAYENGTSNITIDGGRIQAFGGNDCAGIGGSFGGKGNDNITINGGIIEATGGAGTQGGAGIGGGYASETTTNITITGGTVNAKGSLGGAGIGGGGWGSARGITVSGGTVTANGASGIGGGSGRWPGFGENILITGGTVNATGTNGAGIGGASSGDGSASVTITDGAVNAASTAAQGPGIGGYPTPGSSADITVSGGTVTAQAGDSDTPALGATPTFDGYVHKTFGNDAANTESEALVEWSGHPAADWGSWHWVKIEPAAADEVGTVTFVNWDGTTEQKVLRDEIFSAPTPFRAGYTFGGWYKDPDCTPGQEWNFDSETMPDSGVLMLYAKWTANEYPVTFSLNGDTSAVPAVQVATDARIPQPTVESRPGYTFDGWYESDDYSGPQWDFDAAPMPPHALTLYAHWVLNDYTVTFETGGGGPVPPAQKLHIDDPVTEPDEAPVRPGYTFDGWYDDPAYTGKEWDFDTDRMPPDDLTLYAKWTALVYTVTFSLDGDTGTIPTVQVATDARIPRPAVAARPGYVLDGWYTAAGIRWDFARDPMPPRDLTLYARWIANGPAVTVETDGGTPVPPMTPPTAPPAVPRTGDGGVALWWALLLGSGLGLPALGWLRRRIR